MRNKFWIVAIILIISLIASNVPPAKAAPVQRTQDQVFRPTVTLTSSVNLSPQVEAAKVVETNAQNSCEPPTTTDSKAWWSSELVNESGRETDSGTISNLTPGPATVRIEAHSDEEFGCGHDQSDETFKVDLNSKSVTVTHDKNVGTETVTVPIGSNGKLNVSAEALGNPGSGFVFVKVVEEYETCSELGEADEGEWSDWVTDPETGNRSRTRQVKYPDKYSGVICKTKTQTQTENYDVCSELGERVEGEWSDWQVDDESGREFRTRTISYIDKFDSTTTCLPDIETEWRDAPQVKTLTRCKLMGFEDIDGNPWKGPLPYGLDNKFVAVVQIIGGPEAECETVKAQSKDKDSNTWTSFNTIAVEKSLRTFNGNVKSVHLFTLVNASASGHSLMETGNYNFIAVGSDCPAGNQLSGAVRGNG